MKILTTAQLAKRFKLSQGTIRNWRMIEIGPLGRTIPGKRGNPVGYKLDDVRAWEYYNRFFLKSAQKLSKARNK